VALDGAAEAVGEGLESGLGGRRGLDLGGPEAGEDPECEDRKEDALRGAVKAEDSEGQKAERRGEQRDGGAEVRARLGEADAHGEAERGGEQRHAAETERLEGGVTRSSVWPEVGMGQRMQRRFRRSRADVHVCHTIYQLVGGDCVVICGRIRGF
jgi:hypothetical protein